MFQGKYKKLVIGIILLFLLAIFKLYITCTVDKPYLLHEKVQYIILNSPAGRVGYTNNDKPLSEVDDKAKQQQPKVVEQQVIKQQSEEVKQTVNNEPVEKVKQSDKTQSPMNANQGDKTQLPKNNQGDKMQQPLPAVTGNPIKELVNLIGPNDGGTYNSYLKRLSASQINSVIDQLDVTNLTLQKSQIKFLSCGGKKLLKKLKAKQFNISLDISPDFHPCQNMSFKSSGPTVALGSYPGSGNSWVRQLLESATGIYTGAIYCDTAYVAIGMIGEFIDTRNVLVVKTHSAPSTGLLGQYDKAIYVVRNPFSTILAEHNRLLAMRAPSRYGDSHTAEVDYKYVNNPTWDKSVRAKFQQWKSHVTRWLKVTKVPVLIVGFENLKNNTYTELKRMLDFLGYPYSEDSVMCAIKSPSEKFHRKHTKDLQAFSPELRQSIVNDMKQVNADLLKHNISLV